MAVTKLSAYDESLQAARPEWSPMIWQMYKDPLEQVACRVGWKEAGRGLRGGRERWDGMLMR